MQIVERMLTAFKFERFTYLIACIVSFFCLMYCAFEYMVPNNIEAAALMFGSSGIIAATVGRMLYLFSECFKYIRED